MGRFACGLQALDNLIDYRRLTPSLVWCDCFSGTFTRTGYLFEAAYLGIEVERNKILILALGSLLTAAAVSISGLIGFVGLVMPHAVRLSLGPDHRLLLPASALAGAIFVVIADLLARIVLAPVEIPIGVITALVGAPFFLILLRRSRREYAF